MATKFAFLIGKRGTILALASVIAALLGAQLGGLYQIDGFWDGPH